MKVFETSHFERIEKETIGSDLSIDNFEKTLKESNIDSIELRVGGNPFTNSFGQKYGYPLAYPNKGQYNRVNFLRDNYQSIIAENLMKAFEEDSKQEKLNKGPISIPNKLSNMLSGISRYFNKSSYCRARSGAVTEEISVLNDNLPNRDPNKHLLPVWSQINNFPEVKVEEGLLIIPTCDDDCRHAILVTVDLAKEGKIQIYDSMSFNGFGAVPKLSLNYDQLKATLKKRFPDKEIEYIYPHAQHPGQQDCTRYVAIWTAALLSNVPIDSLDHHKLFKEHFDYYVKAPYGENNGGAFYTNSLFDNNINSRIKSVNLDK